LAFYYAYPDLRGLSSSSLPAEVADKQEIKAGMIEGLKIKQTFAQNELQDGDVLTYQVEMSPEQYVTYLTRWR
jgi:hypothetical protein